MSGSGIPQPQSDLTETPCHARSNSQRLEDRRFSSSSRSGFRPQVRTRSASRSRRSASTAPKPCGASTTTSRPVKFPAGLGYEAAGTVDAVGKDVRGFAVGDEVNVIPSFSLNDYSTYGEVILVPDYAVGRQPKSLSFTEAASVWMMFVTAYGALIEDAKVAKGDFILIPAASSSVGLAAIQIANYAGATTIALTRRSTKKQQLLDAGAAHVIATEEADLVAEVMRITNGQGARVAFDPVGGPSFPKLVSALAFGGIIYIYGLLGTGVTPLPVLEMIAKVTTIKAHNMSLTSGDEIRRKAAIEFVTQGLQTGALKPVIDRTFTFDEMADAHRYLEQSGQFGKIVGTV